MRDKHEVDLDMLFVEPRKEFVISSRVGLEVLMVVFLQGGGVVVLGELGDQLADDAEIAGVWYRTNYDL